MPCTTALSLICCSSSRAYVSHGDELRASRRACSAQSLRQLQVVEISSGSIGVTRPRRGVQAVRRARTAAPRRPPRAARRRRRPTRPRLVTFSSSSPGQVSVTSTPSGMPKQSSHGPGCGSIRRPVGQVVVAALLLPGGVEGDLDVLAAASRGSAGTTGASRPAPGTSRRTSRRRRSSVQRVLGELEGLGHPARVRPRVGEVVGRTPPRGSSGRGGAPGGVAAGAVDGVRRGVQRQLVDTSPLRNRPFSVRPHHGTIGKQPYRSPCRSSSVPPTRRLPIRQPLAGSRSARRRPRSAVASFSTCATGCSRRTTRLLAARATVAAPQRPAHDDRGGERSRAAAGAAQRRVAPAEVESGAGTGAYRPRGGAWSTSSALRPIMVRRACAASAGGSSGTVNSMSATASSDGGGTGASKTDRCRGASAGVVRSDRSSGHSAPPSCRPPLRGLLVARSAASSTARSTTRRPVRRTRPPVRRQPVRGPPALRHQLLREAVQQPAGRRQRRLAVAAPRAGPRRPPCPLKPIVVPPVRLRQADGQGELRRAAAARLGALALDARSRPRPAARPTSACRGR